MLFHTPIFFGFFAVFFCLYFLLRKKLMAQNILILVASYIFYGAWDYRFLILIIVSTVTDYLVAIGANGERINGKERLKAFAFLMLSSIGVLSIDLAANLEFLYMVFGYAALLFPAVHYLERKRFHFNTKIYLAISVMVNLGLLAVFKYFNFFAGSLRELGTLAGITINQVTLDIVLPVGISFYTFQTMSYTIDAYRKKLKPSASLIDVSAYVAFFPQLVAGPIERGASLLPQFFKKRIMSTKLIREGAYLFLWGLFKKAVIADNLSILAEPAFNDPSIMSSGELTVALLAFSFQIYCDFSGYSDMARGIARMMGFNLMVNFNVPYFSRTPSEFWQRWHISLSSWLRDYLYIPLGGSRLGKFITYRNLFLTMLLGGLWHGANWTFIAWGVMHGTVLIIYRLLDIDKKLSIVDGISWINRTCANAGLTGLMFVLVVLTWLLFRSSSIEVAGDYLIGIFQFNNFTVGAWSTLGLYLLPLLMHDGFQAYTKNGEFIKDLPFFLRANIVLFIICAFIFLQPSGDAAFIYFDF